MVIGVAEWHEARLLWASRRSLFAVLSFARWGPPVVRVPRLGWLVTDPVLARRVLNDPGHFTLLGEGGVGHLWAQVLGDYVYRIFDGPGHADLRSRARDLFTDAAARPLVRRVFEPTLAPVEQKLRDGGVVDLADVPRVLVGRMMADLLGLDLPDDGDDHYRALFGTGERLARLALGSAASTELPPETVTRAKAIVADLTRNVPSAYAESSVDTLLGRCRELGLSLTETTGLAALLMVAGTETAATAMTRTTALLHDTNQQRLLIDDPELLPSAVREGLRVTTPAPVIGRGVSKDVTVHKARMRAGDRVLLLTYAANNRVGRFDVNRPYVPETRQLWFGAGRHLCLGAALARAEIERFLTAVLSAGPLRIVSRAPAAGVLIPSYQRLLVTRADRHQSAAPAKLVGLGR